jgi:hypothetical protein
MASQQTRFFQIVRGGASQRAHVVKAVFAQLLWVTADCKSMPSQELLDGLGVVLLGRWLGDRRLDCGDKA